MRHMRQMNNIMSSIFSSDPFDMFGGGPLAIGGPRHPAARAGPMMALFPHMNMMTGEF